MAETPAPVAMAAMVSLGSSFPWEGKPPQGGFPAIYESSSSLRTARKASVGTWTVPRERIFFLPSFCFYSSFFFRVTSPP